jgi:hypothetical protein
MISLVRLTALLEWRTNVGRRCENAQTEKAGDMKPYLLSVSVKASARNHLNLLCRDPVVQTGLFAAARKSQNGRKLAAQAYTEAAYAMRALGWSGPERMRLRIGRCTDRTPDDNGR